MIHSSGIFFFSCEELDDKLDCIRILEKRLTRYEKRYGDIRKDPDKVTGISDPLRNKEIFKKKVFLCV